MIGNFAPGQTEDTKDDEKVEEVEPQPTPEEIEEA